MWFSPNSGFHQLPCTIDGSEVAPTGIILPLASVDPHFCLLLFGSYGRISAPPYTSNLSLFHLFSPQSTHWWMVKSQESEVNKRNEDLLDLEPGYILWTSRTKTLVK